MGSKNTKSLTKSTAKKPTTDKRSTDKRKAAEPIEVYKKPLGFMPYVLSVLAILLLLMFTLDGTGFLGNILTPAFMGLFGYGIYAIPVYLFIIAVFWKSDRENNSFAGRFMLCVLNFLFILALIHMHTTDAASRSFTQEGTVYINAFYQNGMKGIGGGAVGGSVGSGIAFLIGDLLTFIIGYITVFITLVFALGSTPARMFKWIINSFRRMSAVKRERRVLHEAHEREKARRIGEKPAEKPIRVLPSEKAPGKASVPAVEYIDDIPAVVTTVVAPPPPPPAPVEAPPVQSAAAEEPFVEYRSIFDECDGDAPLIPEPEDADAPTGNLTVEETVFNAETEIPAAVQDDEEPDVTTEEVELTAKPLDYTFPPISLLSETPGGIKRDSAKVTEHTGQRLIEVLKTYGVEATLVSTSCGPSVTRYEVLPAEGVRVNRIETLANDIRMRLAATSVRIEPIIPGKAAIGIELPNMTSSIVRLRELIDTEAFRSNPSKLLVALGMDVGGNPVYLDIPDMPHLLIAGATGMGKSVCINTIIISIVYRAAPDEVKLILIDPKKVELSYYKGLPHLLVPVVNEPRTAAGSLNWAVNEMERRYSMLESIGSRNLEEYNAMIVDFPEREKIPYIVIIIDELNDLMMTAKEAVDNSIRRLAQKARAAGIYLIMGTQRPSADVITGTIKANIPSRIAFTVSQSLESRIILDENGAESLLGKGDMIYAPVKQMRKIRVQGSFVDREEVKAVTAFVKNGVQTVYSEDVIKLIAEEAKLCGEKGKHKPDELAENGMPDENEDQLFLPAIGVALEQETMSTSLLQRKLSIGYSRAQKIIDMMEERGYVGKFDTATKKRKIYITQEEYDELRLHRAGGGTSGESESTDE